MTTKRTLLIIDPQIDFISGSLPVPEADKAMDKLAGYIQDNADKWDRIVVTMDAHPINHSSFKSEGGIWPPHCVKYSTGASIYPAIMEAISSMMINHEVPITFIEKGRIVEREEYSAFEDSLPEVLKKASHVEVAGIAGEYCVLNSLKDIVKHQFETGRLTILKECIGSFDGGETVENFAKEHNIALG